MKKAPKLSDHQKTELKELLKDRESNPSESRRCQAILMLNDGIDISIIMEYTLFTRSHIYELRKKYIEKGIASLKSKPKKKKELLTKNQLALIEEALRTKSPKDFGFSSDFWTTSVLAYLIKEQFGVAYKSKTSIYILFKKASLSFHKPGQVYKNRNQKVVDEWMRDTLPLVEEVIKDKDTVVLASDEMILRSQTTFQKIWLPRNEFPKIEVSNKRMRISIYGFLDLRSGKQYAYSADRCASNGSSSLK